MTEYIETEAPDDDVEGKVLAALSGEEPYVFIVAAMDDDDGLNLRVASGNSPEVIKTILRKTLAAMP